MERFNLIDFLINHFLEKLQVTDEPVSQEGPGPFELHCGYKGFPVPNVTWFKDSLPLGRYTLIWFSVS